jgi:outer membrane protein
MNRIVLIIVFQSIFFAAKSQEKLNLNEAQKIALENNFGLKIAEKRIELANNQIFKANAGMVPVIDWNTNLGTNLNQVNQNFVDGRVINRFGRSISPNSNLVLSYTLYDGRRAEAIFERLKSQGQLSEIQKQLNIQNTLTALMQSYFTLQRLQNTLEYLNEIIKYYDERLKITEERWQIGRGSKLDYIQSKADLGTQQSTLTSVKGQLKSEKIALNGILGRNPTADFIVETADESNQMYELNALIEKAKTQNPEFLELKKNEEINLLSQKELMSFKKPRINLNSSFGYNFNSTNAGLITFNQAVGLNAGVGMSWRIFDGQLANRNIQSNKINGQIIQIQQNELLNKVENSLTGAYYQFESDKKLLELEKESKALAAENLQISQEKFKLGASTILEINDAQTRYNLVLNRLVNAQLNVKISELELLTISGQLLR